jgi:hypothetical protein
MDTMTRHREIPVQVTAWVDEGVADLVTALNAVPGVETLDSCQEDPGHGLASVMFCTHDDARLYETVSALALAIGEVPHDHVSLSLSWGSDDAPAIADLRCPLTRLPTIAGAIRSSSARMSPCAHDSGDRSPRS